MFWPLNFLMNLRHKKENKSHNFILIVLKNSFEDNLISFLVYETESIKENNHS